MGPDIFEHSISEFTAWIEVVDRKPFFRNAFQKRPTYLTVLRIKEEFSPTHEEDTIYLLEDQGFECYKSLSSSDIGAEYIITGRFDSVSIFASGDSSYSFQRVFILDLCAEGELQVQDDEVTGFIIENKYIIDNQKLGYKSRELQDLWMEYYEKGYLSGESRDEYVAKYDKKQAKYEKKLSRLNDRLEAGRYYQSMSMKKFRKWFQELEKY